jgi:hypothetical protein
MVYNIKTVELNAKYHKPPSEWIQIFRKKNIHFHLGSDGHTPWMKLADFENIPDLIALAEGHS